MVLLYNIWSPMPFQQKQVWHFDRLLNSLASARIRGLKKKNA